MEQRKDERRLSDIRTLTEALYRAYADSGKTMDTVAEACEVKRGYLADALNTAREEVLQFPARKLVKFCQTTSPLPIAWIADQLGYVLVPRASAGTARDVALEALDAAGAAGKLANRVSEAVSDGVIDSQERADIIELSRRGQREFAEVERAAEALPVHIGRRA